MSKQDREYLLSRKAEVTRAIVYLADARLEISIALGNTPTGPRHDLLARYFRDAGHAVDAAARLYDDLADMIGTMVLADGGSAAGTRGGRA